MIERHDIQRDPEYFVSRAAPLDEYLQLHSGGSTGAPRQVFHDASAMVAGSAHFERIRSVMTKWPGSAWQDMYIEQMLELYGALSHALPAGPALESVPAGLRPESAA